MALAPEWVPTVNTLITAFFVLLASLIPQIFISARERKARKEEAQARREQQWADFQMKTLLDLQDALSRLTMVTVLTDGEGRGVMQNQVSHDKLIKTGARYHMILTRTLTLLVRVGDEQSRSLAQSACAAAAEVKDYMARSFPSGRGYDPNTSDKQIQDMQKKFI
jgi:hypothetical protein